MFVGCLLNIPATCECISGMNLLNFMCCHSEKDVADQTFYLTQSQYTDTRPTSPSADPIMRGTSQGSHWSASFHVTGMTRPGEIPLQAGFETRIFRSQSGRLNHEANEAVCLLVAYRPSNMRVYLRDGSAQTILRAATLR